MEGAAGELNIEGVGIEREKYVQLRVNCVEESTSRIETKEIQTSLLFVFILIKYPHSNIDVYTLLLLFMFQKIQDTYKYLVCLFVDKLLWHLVVCCCIVCIIYHIYILDPFCCKTLALSVCSTSLLSVVPHSRLTTQRNSACSSEP